MATGNGTIPNSISIDDLEKGERAILDMVHHDMWQNIATNLGVEDKDHRVRARHVAGRAIPQQEYDSMYREDPVFAKIVDGIPEHGTRKWIKVTAQMDEGDEGSDNVDSNFGADVLDALEDLDAQQRVFELWRLARLDGGAAMIIGADDGKEPEEPLDRERIKTVKHLNVVSRHEIFPSNMIEDITSPNFREPEFYMFTGRASMSTENGKNEVNSVVRSTPMLGTVRGKALEDLGAQRLHHSRVIRMRGIVVADSQSRSLQTGRDDATDTQFWGTPVVQRVYDDLRQYNSIFSHVEAGFKDLAQGIMGIKNLPELLATTKGNELLLRRMTLIALSASSFNMVLFDPDKESYEKRPGDFAGVDRILLRFMEKLSSAAEIPMTKLFGMPPAGMSTDDQSAEKTFNAAIANKQKLKLRKPLNRIIEALLHAKDGPTDGNVPEKWKVGFIPLDEPNESEQATTAKALAETDGLHLLNGTLDEVEVRSRLKNDPDQPYTLRADRDEAMEAMSEPLAAAEAGAMAQQLEIPVTGEAATGAGEAVAAGAPDTPSAPDTPGAVPTAGNVEAATEKDKLRLNGAQITSALEIVTNVANGIFPRQVGVEMLQQFLLVSPDDAARLMTGIETEAAKTVKTAGRNQPPPNGDGNGPEREAKEE